MVSAVIVLGPYLDLADLLLDAAGAADGEAVSLDEMYGAMAWLRDDPEFALLRQRSDGATGREADVARAAVVVRGIGAGWLDQRGYGGDPGRLDGEALLAGARLLAGALTPQGRLARVVALLDPDAITDRILIDDRTSLVPLVGLSRDRVPHGLSSRWERALAGADPGDALLAVAALVGWLITQPHIVPHRVHEIRSLYETARRRPDSRAAGVVTPARLTTLQSRAWVTTTPSPVVSRLTDIMLDYGDGPAEAIPDAVAWEILLAAHASTGVADLPHQPSRWTPRQRAAADAAKNWAGTAPLPAPMTTLRKHLISEGHLFSVQIRPADVGDDVPTDEPPVTPAADARMQVQALELLGEFSHADRAGAWRVMRQILRTGVGGQRAVYQHLLDEITLRAVAGGQSWRDQIPRHIRAFLGACRGCVPEYLVGDAVTAYLAAMNRCDAAKLPILLPTPTISPHIDLYVAAAAATAHDLHSTAGDDRLRQAMIYLRRTDRSVDPARWEPDQHHTAENALTDALGEALARQVRRRPADDRLRRYALCAAYDTTTDSDSGPAHAQLARIGDLLHAAGRRKH